MIMEILLEHEGISRASATITPVIHAVVNAAILLDQILSSNVYGVIISFAGE